MASRLCLTLSCFVLTISMASCAPRITERRPSRDLNKIDGLRAKLYQLRKKIHDLEDKERGQNAAEAGREIESDVSSDLRDISKVHEGMESQMTSRRQKQVQKLAEDLNEGAQDDLHELAETLNKLLRETETEKRAGSPNSAGEYLGDKYNSYTGGEHAHDLSQQLSEVQDNDLTHKTDRSEEEVEEEEEEDEKERLQSIYKMLLRLYSHQEEEKGKSRSPLSDHLSAPGDEDLESARYSGPGFGVEEGTFGDFVDTEGGSRHSAPHRSRPEMRTSVLSAVENKLLDDLRDARTVGISVDDLIQDVQNKVDAERRGKLRQIERELNKLSGEED